jgi:hypothetical protein
MLFLVRCRSCGEGGKLVADDLDEIPSCLRCGCRFAIECLLDDHSTLEAPSLDDVII